MPGGTLTQRDSAQTPEGGLWEVAMPGGWIFELRGRRPCQTLVLTEQFAVAIADEAQAFKAVEPFSRAMCDVHITAKSEISEDLLNDLGIGPGDVRRH